MTSPLLERREHWGSRLGFLLAAAGSAIGLGNLWGFPSKASSQGGAAFVLVYLVVILLVALPLLLTALVIGGGVRGGIERLSLWFMPLLFLVLVALALWASTLSGAAAGYRFYLQPNFGDLFSWPTITAAAGHAFFSLSVGMGAMVTYASYLRGQENLVRLGGTIALADTAVALVGGLITFPLVAHFQLLDKLSDSTIGTLFVAIPSSMGSLGPIGRPIAVFFFLVLVIAALTSAVSLLEVATAGLIDRLGWSRRRATGSAALAVTVLGLLPVLDTRWIDVFYSLFGEAVLLFGGLMMALLLGWLHPALGRQELSVGFSDGSAAGGHAWPIVWWVRMLRFVAVPMLVVLLWQSLVHLPAVVLPLLAS